MEETLSKFMSESSKRHEEISNMIKEIRASTDAAVRNQGASIKTLEIQIWANKQGYSYGASHIDNSIPQKEKDPGSFTLPCYINNVCFDNALADLELATMKYPKRIAENVLVGIGKYVFPVDFIILDMPEDGKVPLILRRPFLSTAHAKIDVLKRKIPLRDQVDDLMPTIEEGEAINEPMIDIIKTRNNESFDEYPSFCDFDKKTYSFVPTIKIFNALVEYGVSNPTEYGVSSSLSNTSYSSQQINTAYPLPLDTAYRSSGTETKIIDFRANFFTSFRDKSTACVLSLFQKHFKSLSLDELRSPDFNLLSDKEYSEEEEEEAMAKTMEQYMRKTRTDYGSGILDSRGAVLTKTAADSKTAIQEMAEYSQKWHNGTSRGRSTKTSDGIAAIQAQLNNLRREIKKVNEKVYAAQVGYEQALMNVPIFVGTFSVMTDFAILEDMDAYRDNEMGDIIFSEPFLREVGIKTKRFKGIITLYNGNNEVTYQMVRSHPKFKIHTNEQCNKIPPLLKVSEKDKINRISHAYQKLKGFYKEVLNLGPDFIRVLSIEEWLTRRHISVHELE
ncbi:homeodomain-like protein [Tanacetum coccineum]|uniref:Homeodomain-like protein n=1 Tax=Tanacetum coccineum TaxID=301880 RepID=A0ABQ5F0H7_9ASTR